VTRRSPGTRPDDNRRVPDNVCPNCWNWSEAGGRTTCKRCGSPSILSDGRRVDEARQDPPPPPPAAFGYPQNPVAPAAAGYGGSAVAVYRPGTDWVAICRWITLGYGLLAAIALIAIGLLLQHINVPVTDRNTGLTTTQTFDIGPAFAFTAVLVGGITALFAWLTKYTAARVIFLLLDALVVLSVFSGAGASVRGGGFGIAELVSIAVDVVYGAALVMSLLPRAQPAYG
jgi:hypothetical protein